ncbi:MAG: hypothetical protein ACREHG_02200 [Candidatus Saccharimonadales bacterium]
MNVFYSPDGGGDLDIDMALILDTQVSIVWDDVLVGDFSASDFVFSPIMVPSICGISTAIHGGYGLKWLRESFGTLPIIHFAFGSAVVYHAARDYFKKLGLRDWIREFSSSDIVNINGLFDAIFRREENEYVHVGKSSLLKFNCMHMRDNLPEYSIFDNILNQGLLFHFKDTHDNIWSV